MKAAVLYSGGKDSSFMAVMLKRLGLDVELCTANFGVYESYIPANQQNHWVSIIKSWIWILRF